MTNKIRLKGKDVKVVYEEIIFLQNSQDFDDFVGSGGKGIDGFFDSTEKEMIDYLAQWDNENSTISTSYPKAGLCDTVSIDEDKMYILSYNYGLGYAGLERIVPKD